MKLNFLLAAIAIAPAALARLWGGRGGDDDDFDPVDRKQTTTVWETLSLYPWEMYAISTIVLVANIYTTPGYSTWDIVKTDLFSTTSTTFTTTTVTHIPHVVYTTTTIPGVPLALAKRSTVSETDWVTVTRDPDNPEGTTEASSSSATLTNPPMGSPQTPPSSAPATSSPTSSLEAPPLGNSSTSASQSPSASSTVSGAPPINSTASSEPALTSPATSAESASISPSSSEAPPAPVTSSKPLSSASSSEPLPPPSSSEPVPSTHLSVPVPSSSEEATWEPTTGFPPFTRVDFTPSITAPFTLTLIEPSGTSSVHCDDSWCSSDGTSYCMRWDGISGTNSAGLGTPGEVFTTIGPCTKTIERHVQVSTIPAFTTGPAVTPLRPDGRRMRLA
ncbi:hypothetical protein J7T55_009606 [Diaporthe amygdali]|uniref:uncharacterized protein n=1 Tax=Phomopsis amygdali TaxID=1214568 RepID=UPI0022FF44F6|nr:uncharacterized protein J7T55_009606 [Diaporthe amygdali]KAJ0109275.1 hypothetical protein J7T55_009606 [Diaporthe amygdali]